MKNNKNFFQISFLVFIALFISNFAMAQCDKKDNKCWLEEGIYQIEEGDFEMAKKALEKSYKGVFNKAPKEIKKEAKEIIGNKMPNFYKPIREHTDKGKQYRADGFFVDATAAYQAAEKLAKRNKRFEEAHTKELDAQLLTRITSTLPELELERNQAFETATTVADEELSKENYPRALSNYTIALREGTTAEKASNQTQQKADKCSFFVHLNKAKDFMASESCETAFEHITKAVNYDSTPEARRVLGEATDCAHDNQMALGNGQLEISAYETAITHFEQAKVYKNGSSEANNGIAEAKNQAAQNYVDQAEAHFASENHAAAAEDFEKAMSYNPSIVNPEGESISSLIEKHYDALNENGESFYNDEDYEGAAADFKAASYYKNKELMEKREAFVLAMNKAYQLEQSPDRLATLNDLSQLRHDWKKAEKLIKGTNLSGGDALGRKIKHLDKVTFDCGLMESMIPNFATATAEQKNVARKELNKIKIDCRYKKDGLKKLGSPLPTFTATRPAIWRTIYDFNERAKYATWKTTTHGTSSVYTVRFGVDSKNKGSARKMHNTMENGRKSTVLHTHPRWTPNGVIRGYFSQINRLPANAKLTGSIGFLKIPSSPKTDGVKFFIYAKYYNVANRKYENVKIYEYHKTYNRQMKSININLSRFAGKKVSFELRVDTGKKPTQDWAIWDKLIIQAKS